MGRGVLNLAAVTKRNGAAEPAQEFSMISLMRAIPLAIALSLGPLAPAFAQAQAPTPPAAAATPSAPTEQPADKFGEDVTLTEKTIIYMKGTANWDTAFDTLRDAFKSVYAYLEKQGIKPAGPAMTIYRSADDTGFSFNAAVPVAELPKEPPKGDVEAGKSPSGKALKFVHRGSYDSMDATYEAITNFLDEKRLDAQDVFVEEYQTDLLTTAENALVVNVYVPVKPQ